MTDASLRGRKSPLTAIEIIVIICFSTAGAVVHGSLGLGAALVAGPALVVIDPGFAPGPLIVIGQIVGFRHAFVERQHTDRQAVRHLVVGLPFGLAAGLAVLSAMSDKMLGILIGSLAAAAAISLLCGLRIRRTSSVEMATGFATAFTSITAGLPGPPLVLTFSEMKPATLGGTFATFVLMVAAAGLIGLVVTGEFGRHELELTGWLAPGVVLGLAIARFVRPYVDRSWFRPAVLIVALAGGIALILRQLT